MFKQIGVCVCVLLCAIKLEGMNVDSIYRHTLSIGVLNTKFSPSLVLSRAANERFVSYAPNYGIGVAYSFFKQISMRSSLGVSVKIGSGKSSYLYNNDSLGISGLKGNIQIQQICIGPEYKLYALKWVNLRLGLPVHYLATDKFDDPSIAERVNWYNEDGKSTFKRIYVSYMIGMDFNIRERFGISFVFVNGINKIGELKTTDKGKEYAFKQKLNSSFISLNYRIR